jgi:hypothetical protein
MSRFDLCPVCYAPMKEDIAYVDYGGPVCEHFINCPNKCYSYEYCYGSTMIYVNIRGHHLMFGWYYTEHDKPQGVKAEQEAVDLACQAARHALLEDLLKDKARLDWLEKDPFDRLEAVDWRLRNWKDTVRSGIDFSVAHEDKAERSKEPSKPSLDNGLAL